MTQPGRPWTEQEIAKILALRDEGLIPADIGPIVGRTPASVQSKLANYVSINRQAMVVPPMVRRCVSRSDYVTQTLMGDPPAGRSALDQRGQP